MARKLSKKDNRYLARLVTRDRVPCAFCLRDVDDEITYGKLYAIGDIHCHYYCCLLSCCLIQKGHDEEGLFGFMYSDILAELERCKKHKCSYCGRSGANLGCSVVACRKQFHLPCGREKNAVSLYFGSYKSFCQQHAPKQKIPEHIMAKARLRMKAHKTRNHNSNAIKIKDSDGDVLDSEETVCVICYEPVPGFPTTGTFWPPCCGRDAWFHRNCLQRMALSAGMHYVKCPLCNDKEHFYTALVDQGYYVPDRDAAWELEQNAFSEMYERAASCGAERCRCPAGRAHDADAGKWDIKLCLLCGSAGAHAHCILQSQSSKPQTTDIDQSERNTQTNTHLDQSERIVQTNTCLDQSERTVQTNTHLDQSERTVQTNTHLDQSERTIETNILDQAEKALDSNTLDQSQAMVYQAQLSSGTNTQQFKSGMSDEGNILSSDMSSSGTNTLYRQSSETNTQEIKSEVSNESNISFQVASSEEITQKIKSDVSNESNISLQVSSSIANTLYMQSNKANTEKIKSEVPNDSIKSPPVISSESNILCVQSIEANESSVSPEKLNVLYVCKSCLPAAPVDLSQLAASVEALVQQEQARSVPHGGGGGGRRLMPSRMSIRRTKGTLRLNTHSRPSSSRSNLHNDTNNRHSESPNVISSREELNLKPPRRRDVPSTAEYTGRDPLLSPVKLLEQSFAEKMSCYGVSEAVVREQLLQLLSTKITRPTPLCVKKRLLNNILSDVLEDMKSSKHIHVGERSTLVYTNVESNLESPKHQDKENNSSCLKTPSKSPRNIKTQDSSTFDKKYNYCLGEDENCAQFEQILEEKMQNFDMEHENNNMNVPETNAVEDFGHIKSVSCENETKENCIDECKLLSYWKSDNNTIFGENDNKNEKEEEGNTTDLVSETESSASKIKFNDEDPENNKLLLQENLINDSNENCKDSITDPTFLKNNEPFLSSEKLNECKENTSRNKFKKLSLKRKGKNRKVLKGIAKKNREDKIRKNLINNLKNSESSSTDVNILKRLLTEKDLCSQLLLELTTGKINNEINLKEVESMNDIKNDINESLKSCNESINSNESSKSCDETLKDLNESLNSYNDTLKDSKSCSKASDESSKCCKDTQTFEDSELERELKTPNNRKLTSKREKGLKDTSEKPRNTRKYSKNNDSRNYLKNTYNAANNTQTDSNSSQNSKGSLKRATISRKCKKVSSNIKNTSKRFKNRPNDSNEIQDSSKTHENNDSKTQEDSKMTPKCLDPTQIDQTTIDDSTLIDTPKRKTIEIQQDSSLEISENDQSINIDVIKVEDSPTSSDSYKKIKVNLPEHNKTCFKFSPFEETLEKTDVGIDLESFKKEYLSEVDRKFVCNFKHKHANRIDEERKYRTPIDFAIEAATKRETPENSGKIGKKRKLSEGGLVLTFDDNVPKKRKTSESELKIVYHDDINKKAPEEKALNDEVKKNKTVKDKRKRVKTKRKRKTKEMKRRSAGNNENIEVTIDASEKRNAKNKRIKTRVAIRNENIRVRIKWKKERLSLNIESKKRRKEKKDKKVKEDTLSKFKQYVLQFPEGSSKEVLVKPEKEVCPLKRKYVKQEKSPDKLKQMSIQSFFKIKSEK